MTAVPVQIDSHALPSARRTAGRTEQKDGSDFTSALGARDEKRTAAKADAEPAAEGISPKGAAGNDEGGPATVEALTAGDPAGQGAAASAEGVPQGLAAILAAVEAGRRGAGSETKAAREPADGKPVGAAIADYAGRAGGGPADMPADPASQKNIFARMPGPATEDARSEIFRRLEATAASIVDADGATLRFAASGQGSPDGRIRADFVSMRTHFAPAGHGTGVPGTGAPGGGAPGFRAVAPARSLAGPDAPMVPDGEPEAGAAFAAGADEASQPSGKAGSASPDNAREAGPAAARPDGRAEARRGADDKDGTAVRLPAAKAETGAASPQGIGFANAPSTGAIPDVPLGRQVASALGGAVSDLRSDLSGSEAEGNLRLRAGGAALKTIQIQLQPAHFGKLDVTMKLVDGHLAIQLLASEPETVMRLKDDTDGLKSLLSQSGFTVDEAAISIALRDPGQPRGGAAPGLADNSAASADGRAASDGASRDEAEGQRGAGGQSGRDGGTDGGGRTSADPQSARRDLDPSIYL